MHFAITLFDIDEMAIRISKRITKTDTNVDNNDWSPFRSADLIKKERSMPIVSQIKDIKVHVYISRLTLDTIYFPGTRVHIFWLKAQGMLAFRKHSFWTVHNGFTHLRRKSTKEGMTTKQGSFVLHIKICNINISMGKCKEHYFNSFFRSESSLISFVHKNAFYNVINMLYMTV